MELADGLDRRELGLAVSVHNKHAGSTSPPARLGAPLEHNNLQPGLNDAGQLSPDGEPEAETPRGQMKRENTTKLKEHISFCIPTGARTPRRADDRLVRCSRLRARPVPGQTTP